MARRPRRTHLAAGPDLHPMTVLDLYYYIVANHWDLIESWEHSQHEVWCACGQGPQVYAHPATQRPVLLALSPRELRRTLRDQRGEPPRSQPAARQLALDFGLPEIDF